MILLSRGVHRDRSMPCNMRMPRVEYPEIREPSLEGNTYGSVNPLYLKCNCYRRDSFLTSMIMGGSLNVFICSPVSLMFPTLVLSQYVSKKFDFKMAIQFSFTTNNSYCNYIYIVSN